MILFTLLIMFLLFIGLIVLTCIWPFLFIGIDILVFILIIAGIVRLIRG